MKKKTWKDHPRPCAGKGDGPRPVDKKKFDENWERIFGKKYRFFTATLDPIIRPKNAPSDLDDFERWWNNPKNQPPVSAVAEVQRLGVKQWMRRAFAAGRRSVKEIVNS